jgi:ectoine hydroxylase-related dioxygenase (phytanoyl-CoA dioxygenase family)
MFVFTDPPTHLLASWIALEDILPDSGPLAYVPGSQHLPWYEFEPGSVVCGQGVSAERRAEFRDWTHAQMRERGLEVQAFTARRGDVFIWHAGLVHGGTPIENASRTRRSFVVHYCTAAHKTSRTARMRVRDGDDWRREARTTERVIEGDDARGLENPLRN